jgi:ribosomal protein S18 acetylase RimI-like enzyme
MTEKMLKIRRYKPKDNAAAKDLNYAGLAQMRLDIDWRGIEVADGDYDDIENIYINNRGDFLVGTIDNEVVVTGAVKKLGEDCGEIKRIRVKPEYQRKGYGEAMTKALIKRAAELGYNKIRIDTMTTNTRAQALFSKLGFKEAYRGKIGDYDVIFYFLELRGEK